MNIEIEDPILLMLELSFLNGLLHSLGKEIPELESLNNLQKKLIEENGKKSN